jgi:hypothetical protein
MIFKTLNILLFSCQIHDLEVRAWHILQQDGGI